MFAWKQRLSQISQSPRHLPQHPCYTEEGRFERLFAPDRHSTAVKPQSARQRAFTPSMPYAIARGSRTWKVRFGGLAD
jgi:hypothetical protein